MNFNIRKIGREHEQVISHDITEFINELNNDFTDKEYRNIVKTVLIDGCQCMKDILQEYGLLDKFKQTIINCEKSKRYYEKHKIEILEKRKNNLNNFSNLDLPEEEIAKLIEEKKRQHEEYQRNYYDKNKEKLREYGRERGRLIRKAYYNTIQKN